MGSVADAAAASWSVSPELGAALAKAAVFALVQALVYLVLRKSSDVFSPARCRFRPMRSMSVRRVLASFSDVPVGIPEDAGAPSPSSAPVDPTFPSGMAAPAAGSSKCTHGSWIS